MGLWKKYQMLSPELLHHLPLVLLLLPPDVFKILLTANSGTPETKECNPYIFKTDIIFKAYLASSIMMEENLLFSMLRSSKSSSRYFLLSYLHTRFNTVSLREGLLKKKRRKKGTLSPLGDPPPLNGSKGDICRLITDKSA